eukprot:scaffold6984_cov55-Isochrysis_galbana.AAC.1
MCIRDSRSPLPRLPSSFFSASLDRPFLAVRARCLEAYLAAAAGFFGASLATETGPPPLLDFLRPAAGGGSRAVPFPDGGAVLFPDGAVGLTPPALLLGGGEPPRTPLPAPPAPGAPGSGIPGGGTGGEGGVPDGGEGGIPEGGEGVIPEKGTRLPHGALMSRLVAAAAAQPCPAEKDPRALRERREVSGFRMGGV